MSSEEIKELQCCLSSAQKTIADQAHELQEAQERVKAVDDIINREMVVNDDRDDAFFRQGIASVREEIRKAIESTAKEQGK
jgi:hypothetical protein